jgi:hypothetical protein
MRIVSVARISGPADERHYFMVTRWDGLLGRLRNRKLWAVVRYIEDAAGSIAFWGTSSDECSYEVTCAVQRFVREEHRREMASRIRGDRYWQPFTPPEPTRLLSARSES